MSSVTPEKMLKRYDVSRRDYEDIAEILEESCQDAAKRVRSKVAELRAMNVAGTNASIVPATEQSAPSTRMTASVSPSRSALASDSERELSLSPHKTPSKSALRTDSEREASLSPHKTPTHKRKVAFAELGDADTELLDTPSKRPRLASPAKPTRSQAVSPAKPKQTEPSTPAEPPLTQLQVPTAVPNPSAISPSKPSRPSGGGPPPLPALTMPKPSIFPSAKSASAQSPLDLLAQRSSSRSPWNSSSPTRPQTRSQTQPQPTPKPAPPAPVAGPSTPSRRGRPPKAEAAAGTPMTPARTLPGHATPGRATPGRSPARRRVSAALAAFDEDEDAGRSRRFRPVFLDQKQWFQRDPRAEREWRMVEARMRENGMGPLTLGRAGRRPVSA